MLALRVGREEEGVLRSRRKVDKRKKLKWTMFALNCYIAEEGIV